MTARTSGRQRSYYDMPSDGAFAQHAAMNVEAQFVQVKAEQSALRSTVTEIAGAVTQLSSKLDLISEKFSSSHKTNWPVLIGIITAMIAFFTAAGGTAWFVINQNAQLAIKPIEASIASMVENQHTHDAQVGRIMDELKDQDKLVFQSALADTSSRQDRGQLNDRMKTVEQRSADIRAERDAELAALQEKLTEIETQFRAEDTIRNLTSMAQDRMNSLLWTKSFPGVPYPATGNYFPEMSQSGEQLQLRPNHRVQQ